jgi:hypothetical protein
MKRRRTKRNRSLRVIRLWNHPEAKKALPYITSITKSLREHWLEVQSKRVDCLRLGRIARLSRTDLIALEETQAAQGKAENAFNEALEELMSMDVFLLDPVHGTALIPFQQDEELAWYVFELFDEAGLTAWRFHKDPLEMRRTMPTDRAVTAAT